MLAFLPKGDQNIDMKELKLTKRKKTDLEKRHKQSRDAKECDRIKAILLRSEGWTIPMIAQALRIHESTIIRHINDCQEGKLTITSGGSNSHLNEKQTQELISHLEERTYQSTHAIVAYIKEEYGISYTVPGLNKWLHRNGFSYKKPKGHPYKACKEQQEKFIESYDALKKSIGSDEGIFFMDACHPSMATKISHGWIKKGQSKAIETSASRTRMNLIGAINLADLAKPILASYSTVDSESIVDFLKQTRKLARIPGKIHLFLDQAGYHRTDEVLLAAENLNIQLHYLPPYSPNLNPIERLWKIMNEYARNNYFFNTAQVFRKRITSFFKDTLPKILSILKSRINDNFQKLDYAF